MTPEELKKMALDAAKPEFDEIYRQMQLAAKEGRFSCDFKYISDAAKEHLRNEGFEVIAKPVLSNSPFSGGPNVKSYYQVRFSKS